MLDYPSRLDKARSRMAERNVGLMYLTMGANLFYLTGVRRQQDHGTDHNRFGDWATGGFIGLSSGVDLIAARMGGGYFSSEPSILSVQGHPTPGNLFSRVEDVVQVTDQGGISLYTADRGLTIVG